MTETPTTTSSHRRLEYARSTDLTKQQVRNKPARRSWVVATATVAAAALAIFGVLSLTVDHWYRGGNAAEVSLIGPAGMEALIGGIAFETGGSYLINAQEGTVNYCGYCGEAAGDLRAGFDQAFGN